MSWLLSFAIAIALGSTTYCECNKEKSETVRCLVENVISSEDIIAEIRPTVLLLYSTDWVTAWLASTINNHLAKVSMRAVLSACFS